MTYIPGSGETGAEGGSLTIRCLRRGWTIGFGTGR